MNKSGDGTKWLSGVLIKAQYFERDFSQVPRLKRRESSFAGQIHHTARNFSEDPNELIYK